MTSSVPLRRFTKTGSTCCRSVSGLPLRRPAHESRTYAARMGASGTVTRCQRTSCSGWETGRHVSGMRRDSDRAREAGGRQREWQKRHRPKRERTRRASGGAGARCNLGNDSTSLSVHPSAQALPSHRPCRKPHAAAPRTSLVSIRRVRMAAVPCEDTTPVAAEPRSAL